jgi:uncharacterized protein
MVNFEYRFRPPRMTPESRGGTEAEYRRTVEDGMLVERDVPVTLRAGDTIFVDVFRPMDDAVAAPLVSWMPYGKHNPLPIQKIFPDAGVKNEWTSRHTAFECPDPVYWVRHGYAVVLADLPGTWNSGGRQRTAHRRRRSRSTTSSNGQARNRGATGRSGCPASPI